MESAWNRSIYIELLAAEASGELEDVEGYSASTAIRSALKAKVCCEVLRVY